MDVPRDVLNFRMKQEINYLKTFSVLSVDISRVCSGQKLTTYSQLLMFFSLKQKHRLCSKNKEDRKEARKCIFLETTLYCNFDKRNLWKYSQKCNFSKDYNTTFKITGSYASGIFNQTVQTNTESKIRGTTGEYVRRNNNKF
jgi:hypothetical protein